MDRYTDILVTDIRFQKFSSISTVAIRWTGVGSSVKIVTGYGGNWCGTSVEFMSRVSGGGNR